MAAPATIRGERILVYPDRLSVEVALEELRHTEEEGWSYNAAKTVDGRYKIAVRDDEGVFLGYLG